MGHSSMTLSIQQNGGQAIKILKAKRRGHGSSWSGHRSVMSTHSALLKSVDTNTTYKSVFTYMSLNLGFYIQLDQH